MGDKTVKKQKEKKTLKFSGDRAIILSKAKTN